MIGLGSDKNIRLFLINWSCILGSPCSVPTMNLEQRRKSKSKCLKCQQIPQNKKICWPTLLGWLVHIQDMRLLGPEKLLTRMFNRNFWGASPNSIITYPTHAYIFHSMWVPPCLCFQCPLLPLDRLSRSQLELWIFWNIYYTGWFFDWPSLVKYQNEKRPLEPTRGSLRWRIHGTAFFISVLMRGGERELKNHPLYFNFQIIY